MRRQLGAVLLALAASVSVASTDDGAVSAATPPHCAWSGDAIDESEQLLSDRYRFVPHPAVKLPRDLRWTEDPLRDRNWKFQLHSLRYVSALLDAWSQTGDRRYRARATGLLKDWIRDNPRDAAPTFWAWTDHSTSPRARVLVCAAEILGLRGWLRRALVTHGEVLAAPGNYVRTGNHALSQNLALLDIGHALGHEGWKALAWRRTAALAPRSITRDGVTNEQSIGYQLFNHALYSTARDLFVRFGMAVPPGVDRVDLMADFLAYATLPNGEYETIGDTDIKSAEPIEGTIAEFAATNGRSGPKPQGTDALYRSEGYLFARTGWGEVRPFRDEVAYSLRFGPALRDRLHGHHDGGSVTLYGYGARQVVDPGKYTYDRTPFRTYFVSHAAHNVVVVDGMRFRASATKLLAHRADERHIDTTLLNDRGYRGVSIRRRTIFSRSGYLLVEDRIRSDVSRRYHQLWHLAEGSRPSMSDDRLVSDGPEGDLTIIQLAGGSSDVVIGARDPIQGWVSPSFNKKVEAPVLITSKSGRKARFVTLLAPSAAGASVEVTDWRLTPGGIEAVVRIGDHRERIRVSRDRVDIEPVDLG